MPSTYSTDLRLELMATGENRTTWGSKANQVFNMAEDAIAGAVTVSMANTNYSLTTANGTVDEARNMIIEITGTHTAIRTLTIPAVSKMYIMYNNTTGGFAITVSNGTNTASLAAGKWYVVWTDGTLVFASPDQSATYALLSQLVDLSGVTTPVTARTNLGLGTMAVQNAATVAITGGTVTGITDLALADGGTGASDAATARTNLGLGTIATQAASAVAITGGTITGITDLALADGGTGASDAATARTNLGLSTMATQSSSSVSITGGTITGITDLALADGGTGASTAANARTNLGLVIGTNVQAYDATLDSLAAVSGVAGDVLYANGTDTWTRLAKGTAGQSLVMNAGATAPSWSWSSGAPDVVIEDQKAQGTAAQTISGGTFNTRDLTTKVRDPNSYVSLATNQFTPTVAGWVEWECPGYGGELFTTRLFNVTDSTVAGVGMGSRSNGGGEQHVVTSSGGAACVAGKTYAIQQNGGGTGGNPTNTASTIEVYTRVRMWRTA